MRLLNYMQGKRMTIFHKIVELYAGKEDDYL